MAESNHRFAENRGQRTENKAGWWRVPSITRIKCPGQAECQGRMTSATERLQRGVNRSHLSHNQPSTYPDVETSDTDGQSYYAIFFLTDSRFILFWPCSLAWGILVPRPEMEPQSPVLGTCSLHHWTTGKVLCHFMEGTWASEVWIRRRSWNQPFMDTEWGLHANFPLTFFSECSILIFIYF